MICQVFFIYLYQQIFNNFIMEEKFNIYVSKLEQYLGEDTTATLLSFVPEIKTATFAPSSDSGLAFDGSLIDASLTITTLACKLNALLPEERRVDVASIVKVGLLAHISKALMFEPNDDQWQINNRGMVYKFKPLKGALRGGERSILLCANAGVKLTEEEYEAMRIMGKNIDDDAQAKLYSSNLSTIIRQANELLYIINRVN